MSSGQEPTPSRWRTVWTASGRPALRRLAVLFACFRSAEIGEWITMTALAHHYGGVREASLVMIVQLAPSALAATSVGVLADRWGVRRVMVTGLFLQAAGMLTTGVLVAAGADHLLIYAAAVVAAVCMVTTRPTVLSLLPVVVDGPRELSAGLVVIGWVDGLGLLLGPAITGLTLASGSYATAFVVFGLLNVVGAVLGLLGPSDDRRAPGAEPADGLDSSRSAMATVWRTPGSRAALVVLAAQMFVVGALDLLVVLVAVDLLDEPASMVGWLSTSFGVGALVGGVAAATLVGRRVVWPVAAGAAVVMVLVVAVLGGLTQPVSALAGFLVTGAASAMLLISTRTILQHISSVRLIAHTFSMVESLDMSMLLIAAAVVPLLVELTAVAWAPVGIATLAAVALACTFPTLGRAEERADVPVARIAVLSRVPVLAVLPADVIAGLAKAATPESVDAGTTLFHQGDPGDTYYAVESGRVAIVQNGVRVRSVGPGEAFGEYALLRHRPRSATIVAETDVDLLAVSREDFLFAVLGNAASRTVAERYAAAVEAADLTRRAN